MLILLFIMSIIGVCVGVFSTILNYDTDKEIKEVEKNINETRKQIRDKYKNINENKVKNIKKEKENG